MCPPSPAHDTNVRKSKHREHPRLTARKSGSTGIVSAPLWDSKASKFAGLLTTSDYINVIQYYFQNPAALDQIDQFRLDSLRGAFRPHLPTWAIESPKDMYADHDLMTDVEKALGVAPPETISIDPERPLYEACRRMLESRARRIPLVTNDSQTDRSHVLSVITQYRILKFVAVNVPDTQMLRRPLGELKVGTYTNIATASMDTPVIDVIHILVERSISSMPILNSDGMEALSQVTIFNTNHLYRRCLQRLRVGRCYCADSRWRLR